MRIHRDLECLLIKEVDGRRAYWLAWCPQLDVMTHGDHVDHAVAMLEEAVRLVIEDGINDMRVDGFGNTVWKRVQLPERFGTKASEDESWDSYQRLLKDRDGKRRGFSYFDLAQLDDGLDDHILVSGYYRIETRAGVFKVDVGRDRYGYVPAEVVAVEYTEAYPRKLSVSLRKSIIDPAGAKGEELATAEIMQSIERKKYRDETIIGEVKVSRDEDA